MKVYIAFELNHEGYRVLGVFTTKESAQAAGSGIDPKLAGKPYGFHIESHELKAV